MMPGGFMRTDELDFELPAELIAQSPAPQRTDSRLLRYMRGDRSISHHTFSDLPTFLHKGDLLVFNDARVIPARFTLHKSTGGRVEGLFIDETAPGNWARAAGRTLADARRMCRFILRMIHGSRRRSSKISGKENIESTFGPLSEV